MQTSAMIDMIIAACGFYVIGNYIVMRMSGQVQGSMLLPKNFAPEKCKDPKGYLSVVGLKQVLFGVCAIVCGLIGLLQDLWHTNLTGLYVASLIVFLLCTVLYTKAIKRAVKEYW